MASPPPNRSQRSPPSPSDDHASALQEEDVEEADADLPLTMAASIVLENLPRDAHSALQKAGEVVDAKGVVREKVKVRLSPLPGVKAMRTPVFNCGAAQRFEFVVRFLRRRLQVAEAESVFCYVNSVFAPGLDEGVGNLWRCFKTGDELVVNYSIAQAFG